MGPHSRSSSGTELPKARRTYLHNEQHRQSGFYDDMTPMKLLVLASHDTSRNELDKKPTMCLLYISVSRKIIKQTKERGNLSI